MKNNNYEEDEEEGEQETGWEREGKCGEIAEKERVILAFYILLCGREARGELPNAH